MKCIRLVLFFLLLQIVSFSQNPPGSEYMTSKEKKMGHTMMKLYNRLAEKEVIEDSVTFFEKLDSIRVAESKHPRRRQVSIIDQVPPPMGTQETYADGQITGQWQYNYVSDPERGVMGRYGHWADQSAYNPVTNTAYFLNNPHNVTMGSLVENGSLEITNQNINIAGNFFTCIVRNDGSSRLIGGVNIDEGQMCYSDDEGMTWYESTGGEFGGNDVVWGAQFDNTQKTLIVHIKKWVWTTQWDYSHLILVSDDMGETYEQVALFKTNDLDAIVCNRPHNSEYAYVVIKRAGQGNWETYRYQPETTELTYMTTTSMSGNPKQLFGTRVNNQTYLYVGTDEGDASKGYLSTNEGQSWEYRSTHTDWKVLSSVHPEDPDELLFSSAQMTHSTDGGATINRWSWWEDAFGWDNHTINWFRKSDGTLFMMLGNDFGNHFVTDPHNRSAWKHMNIRNVHQILHHGAFEEKTDLLVTGNQDRGTLRWDKVDDNEYEGKTMYKADGLRVEIANHGKSYWYIHYWGVMYHNNAPITGNEYRTDIALSDPTQNWYTPPMAASTLPGEDAIYVTGWDQLMKLTYNWNTNSITKTILPFNFTSDAGEVVYGVATAPSDPDRIYACTRNGVFYYSSNAGASWTRTSYTGSFPEVDGWRTWGSVGYAIKVSQNDPDMVFVAGLGDATNAMLKSTDGGQTFTPVTNGISDAEIHEICLTSDDKYVFASNMEVYVIDEDRWYSLKGGSCPRGGAVNGVSYMPQQNKIRYYTYGMGVLDFQINGTSGIPYAEITSPSTHDFEIDAPFTVSVAASDSDGEIVRIELYDGEQLIQERTNSPFTFIVESEVGNSHSLRAIAYDDAGNRTISYSVDVVVSQTHIPDYQLPYADNVIPGIIEAENYDTGGEDIAYFDLTSDNLGGEYRTDGVDIQASINGYNIGWTETGEWLEYTVNVAEAGAYTVNTLLSDIDATGIYSLQFDGNIVIDSASVPETGDYLVWQQREDTLYLDAGVQVMRTNILNGGFNIDNYTFERLDIPYGEGTGLLGLYYNGMEFDEFVTARTDESMTMNWNDASPVDGVNEDAFSVKWYGKLQPQITGEYTIYITSDNGRRVWIDGQLIIDRWVDDWDIEYSGTITLDASRKYDIVIEYFENNGGANIRLDWKPPYMQKHEIPSSQLYPSALQTFLLERGWNLISFNVSPSDSTVESVFDVALLDVTVIKTDEKFYLKEHPAFLNSLKTISGGKAYLVYMTDSVDLQVIGQPLNSHQTQLKAGWNLLGIPRQSSVTIDDVLDILPVDCVKNFEGFWENNSDANSIDTFTPGKGYFIKVNSDCSISW